MGRSLGGCHCRLINWSRGCTGALRQTGRLDGSPWGALRLEGKGRASELHHWRLETRKKGKAFARHVLHAARGGAKPKQKKVHSRKRKVALQSRPRGKGAPQRVSQSKKRTLFFGGGGGGDIRLIDPEHLGAIDVPLQTHKIAALIRLWKFVPLKIFIFIFLGP